LSAVRRPGMNGSIWHLYFTSSATICGFISLSTVANSGPGAAKGQPRAGCSAVFGAQAGFHDSLPRHSRGTVQRHGPRYRWFLGKLRSAIPREGPSPEVLVKTSVGQAGVRISAETAAPVKPSARTRRAALSQSCDGF
jgi:hypothetical protein